MTKMNRRNFFASLAALPLLARAVKAFSGNASIPQATIPSVPTWTHRASFTFNAPPLEESVADLLIEHLHIPSAEFYRAKFRPPGFVR